MGIFNRIADVFKANVNDALDKAEDPEKMLKQMVIEMEESVNKTALAVANSIANEKSLERKIEKSRREKDDWEQKAMQALSSGREDLARAALEKKSISIRNLQDLEPIFKQAKETSNKMRTQLNELKSKLEEARSRQHTLIARSQAAKAQKEISESMGGLGSDAFSKFDKYEQKIEKLEAQAEAYGEISGEDIRLEDEFKKLGTGATVDNELLALKEKMGLLPKSSETSTDN